MRFVINTLNLRRIQCNRIDKFSDARCIANVDDRTEAPEDLPLFSVFLLIPVLLLMLDVQAIDPCDF